MADKFLNNTGLEYYHNRIKQQFATKDELDVLDERIDDIVSEGGEPNTIDSISVNGTAQTITNKNVDITVPTKTSDLTNDGDGTSNFATEAYVTTNGGKIDKIKVNGTEQTITNKEVNIAVPTKVSDLTNDGDGTTGSEFATKSYVDQNGGKIDVIKVNGTAQTIANKEVDIAVPTKTSDITNDSNFQTATEVQSAISTAVASAYKYKGSVASQSALPSSADTGDVYDVQDTGMNYAWNGTSWDALGQIVDTSVLWTSQTGQANTLEAMTVAEIDAILNPSA